MTAKELLLTLKTLKVNPIGCVIDTARIGSYPGGRAKIIAVKPDPAAPEIIFTVFNRAWKKEDRGDGVIVFDYEPVTLLSAPKR